MKLYSKKIAHPVLLIGKIKKENRKEEFIYKQYHFNSR